HIPTPHIPIHSFPPRRSSDLTPDEVNGFHFLHQAYAAASPRYTGKVTVPTLWDKKTRRIVNNESSEIIRMLNSEFKGIAGDDTRSEEHTSELQSRFDLVCRLL